jgi:ABC-type multidrug transport system ATPase subunit
MNGAILGMKRAEIDSKLDEIVEFSEVAQFIDTPVKRYSSGMYVKLAFSVAAHLDSEIMVMDEVLAVGDMKFQQKCLGRMGDAANSEGRTVLYVSHNMNTIRQLCKRCIVMDHGKIIFDGNTEEAIAVYMENDSKMALTIDCSGERSYKDIDGKIRFENITFLNRADSPIYSQGERVQLKVRYNANKELHNFAFRVVIQTPDKVRVGMAMSGQILHTDPGTHSFHVEFPIDWLAPGK